MITSSDLVADGAAHAEGKMARRKMLFLSCRKVIAALGQRLRAAW